MASDVSAGAKRGARPGGIVASRARASSDGLGVDGTSLTATRHAAIVACLRAGNYHVTAAAVCGVPKRTLESWLAAGRDDPDGAFGRFTRDCDEAESAGEVERVKRISDAGEAGDWKADAWWLERRGRERWQVSQRSEVAATVAVVPELSFSAPEARAELERRVVERYGDRAPEVLALLLRTPE